MRKWTLITMLTGLFLASVATTAPAAEGKDMKKMDKMEKMDKSEMKSDKATIEGTLVDMKCYLTMGATGEGHASCGMKCAKSGVPMGILPKDSKEVYTLLVASPMIADYAEQTVRATGTMVGHSFAPDKLEVQKDGKWEEVKISGGM